jgi:hypothetical protein
MTDQPVGRRNGETKEQEEREALGQAEAVAAGYVGRVALHLSHPPARNLQAGHSPQP